MNERKAVCTERCMYSLMGGRRKRADNVPRQRPTQLLNRASSKRSGRLPPSIKTNVEEVIRVVRQIPLPISKIIIEDVQVDIARLNDPTLAGSRYQEPTRLVSGLLRRKPTVFFADSSGFSSSFVTNACKRTLQKLIKHHILSH